MSVAPTDSLYTFTKAIQAIIAGVQEVRGIADIFYGDQQQIPRTPTVCVIADKKTRTLEGMPRRVLNTITCFVIIYHSKIQDIQLNSAEADQLAEAIEADIHADPIMGGLVIHSMVTDVEAGQLSRMVNTSQTQFRSTRLTVEGISKTMLPMNPGYNQP